MNAGNILKSSDLGEIVIH